MHRNVKHNLESTAEVLDWNWKFSFSLFSKETAVWFESTVWSAQKYLNKIINVPVLNYYYYYLHFLSWWNRQTLSSAKIKKQNTSSAGLKMSWKTSHDKERKQPQGKRQNDDMKAVKYPERMKTTRNQTQLITNRSENRKDAEINGSGSTFKVSLKYSHPHFAISSQPALKPQTKPLFVFFFFFLPI